MSKLEEIKEKLEESKEFLNELSQYLDKSFYIEGKTIVAWKKYFKIEIPDEINFGILVSLAAEIAKKYQIASSFRDKQNIQMAMLEQAKFDKYYKTYNNLREETQEKTGKPLAAESCKVAATLASSDLENAISIQKVVKDFWNRTCESLTEVRKLLEIASFALSADAKTQRDFNVYTNKE